MRVKILRHWVTNEVEYGEYYICSVNGKYLCFQNGDDIKILSHWRDKSVKDCLCKPTEEVVDKIRETVKEYIKAGNDKLKPCPFCGSEAEVSFYEQTYNGDWITKYYVSCTGCHIALLGSLASEEKQKAIDAWNRRVTNASCD